MAPRTLTPPVLGADASQKAVAALRNVALSSDYTLNYLPPQKVVIPQLVQLMTKMHAVTADASRSARGLALM